MLALADLELAAPATGSPRSPRSTGGSRPSGAPRPPRAAAAAALARARRPTRSAGGALAAEYRGGDAPRRAARAADAVDQLDFVDVARLREELPRDAPVQEALAMKLARIQLHLRDYPRAEETAREVFLRWPDGPYARRREGDRRADLAGSPSSAPTCIGVAVPLSGNYKRWGEAILQGVARRPRRGAPGCGSSVRDTRGEPDGAAAAIEALALEEGAIVDRRRRHQRGGGARRRDRRGAAGPVRLALEAGGAHPRRRRTSSRTCSPRRAQAKALAELAMERRGMRRFAIMFPSVPYGVELANAFWDEVEARGGEVRGAETYAADRTTFTPLVK